MHPPIDVKGIVNNYEFLQPLGEGAFSVVYKVRKTNTGETFACKVFSKLNLHTEDDTNHFQREVNAMAFMRHENCVQLHDFFWDEANFYMIIDFCSGGALFDYIVDHDRVDEPTAAFFFKQIVSAIDYCHGHGLAHRDIKPDNILIDQFPHIKISDFGLCGFIQNERLMKTFCGSPCYCSPECISRIQYDGKASDIWSLGVVLFAIVTGEHPWNISNVTGMIRQILKGSFSIPSYVSAQCSDLIKKMMQHDPKRRITTKEILAHPWLGKARFSKAQKANIKCAKSADLPILSSGVSIENLSELCAQNSQQQDHGVISPFANSENGTPELCFSIDQIPARSINSMTNLPLLSQNKSPARRSKVVINSKPHFRQRSSANLLAPHVVKPHPSPRPCLHMASISEE